MLGVVFLHGGLTEICRDVGTVRQCRKTPGLAPGQFYDAGTDAGTVLRRHKTDAKRDASPGDVLTSPGYLPCPGVYER